jgi:Domain of unknown function (DUF4375)
MGNVYWTLVEPHWEIVSIYDGYDVFLAEFKKLPQVSQHLFATHWAQSEIRNGGIDQFFDNSTGVLAKEAVEGFKALGMLETAELLQQSMDVLVTPYPQDRDERQERLSELPDPFFFEDVRFWELLDEEADGFHVAANRYASKAIN